MTTLLFLLVLALIWIGLRDTRQPRVSSFRDRTDGRVAPAEQRSWRERRGGQEGGVAPNPVANSLAS